MTKAATDHFCSTCQKWNPASHGCSADCASCMDCCDHLLCTKCCDRCATFGTYCTQCKPAQSPCNHVVYDCAQGRFVCENCLSEFHLSLPMQINEVTDISRAFLAVHQHCRPQSVVDRDQFGPKFLEFIKANYVGALLALESKKITAQVEGGHAIFAFELTMHVRRPE